MKEIAVVATVPLHLNGISSVIMNLYKASQQNFSYTVITNEEADPSYQQAFLAKDRLLVLSSRKKRLNSYLKELRDLVKENNFSVLHIHGNSETMILEALVAKTAGFEGKIIFHTHNTKKSNPLYHRLNPMLRRLGDQYIACGQKAGENLYGTTPFMVIKNGIFLEKFQFSREVKEQFCRKYHCQGKIVLGHIGRFNYQKNQLFLLDLLTYWRETQPNFFKDIRLFLVGDGEKKAEVTQAVMDKNLQQQVTILASGNCPEAFYSFFDYLLLPSFFEGFPLVAVESQAAGLPGIYSNRMDPKVQVGIGISFADIQPEEPTFQAWEQEIRRQTWQREELCRENQKKLQAEGFDIVQVARKLAALYEQ